MTNEDRSDERRVPPARRKYTRRTDSADPSPPYFEVFQRIASALEGIAETLLRVSPSNEIRLPQDAASDASLSTRTAPAAPTRRR